MKKRFWQATGLLLAASAAVLLVVGLNVPMLAAQAMASGTEVDLATNDKMGTFLVDSKGMALYMFTKDTKDTSVCYGGCADAWPPLLTTDNVVLGKGVMSSLQSTTKRKDGTMQVTYAGWPLYYFKKDKMAGDITGQGVGNVWYLLAADGSLIKTAM